jgi:hypothetical protein
MHDIWKWLRQVREVDALLLNEGRGLYVPETASVVEQQAPATQACCHTADGSDTSTQHLEIGGYEASRAGKYSEMSERR